MNDLKNLKSAYCHTSYYENLNSPAGYVEGDGTLVFQKGKTYEVSYNPAMNEMIVFCEVNGQIGPKTPLVRRFQRAFTTDTLTYEGLLFEKHFYNFRQLRLAKLNQIFKIK